VSGIVPAGTSRSSGHQLDQRHAGKGWWSATARLKWVSRATARRCRWTTSRCQVA